MRGKFITFEGVDGAGKSTHVEWFANALRSAGRAVAVTREPGGSALAEKLRELVLHENMDAVTETLLVFTARDDHLRRRIVPALAAGTWVICDRFTDATVAYQGGGKGVERGLIEKLREIVHPSVRPDCTLIFDCPYAVSRDRMERSRRALDRFEREGEAFALGPRIVFTLDQRHIVVAVVLRQQGVRCHGVPIRFSHRRRAPLARVC